MITHSNADSNRSRTRIIKDCKPGAGIVELYRQVSSGKPKYIGKILDERDGTLELSMAPEDISVSYPKVGIPELLLTDNSLDFRYITIKCIINNKPRILVSSRQYFLEEGCLQIDPNGELKRYVDVDHLTYPNTSSYEQQFD